MFTYGFEKLSVWEDARDLTVLIYKVTSTFPKDEKFGLTNQIRRSAISIASNIAEGSGRKSVKDQVHFYHLAYSSNLELLNQLIISKDLLFISGDILIECRRFIEKISNKINNLRKSILASSSPKQLNN
ncbi:MAG: four helix bundle protein [Flavisolibacter sp.]|jgi:four helix bundle protein|nr:four helix bundle protein [Flavisolibacter sp.]